MQHLAADQFAEIGRLDLLKTLPGRICLTPAVRDELLAKASLFPDAANAAVDGSFELRTPEDELLFRSLASSLHRGEAECLALGMENPGSLLILDDLSARAVAAANGLPFTGTLGILAAPSRVVRWQLWPRCSKTCVPAPAFGSAPIWSGRFSRALAKRADAGGKHASALGTLPLPLQRPAPP